MAYMKLFHPSNETFANEVLEALIEDVSVIGLLLWGQDNQNRGSLHYLVVNKLFNLCWQFMNCHHKCI